jgi:lipopolysaccharide transport system permease protein
MAQTGESMGWGLFKSNLVAPTLLVFQHRALTLALIRREVFGRYAGQMLGAFWVFGHPLIMMAVYVFVFQYVCNMRLGGTLEMPLDYTAYILSGLIPWLTFAETLGKGPTVLVSNANLVKQVVFPVEILPIKTVLASFTTQILCTILLIAYVVISSGSLPWTYALLPVLWLAQFLAMAGVCFVLSAVGTYFRDLKEFVQVFAIVGMYMMPVAYLPEWAPAMFRPILYLNPFSYMAWCYQDACYFGRFEHLWAWLVFIAGSIFMFAFGYRLFCRLKFYFGNVL